jgi:hypothetical protein
MRIFGVSVTNYFMKRIIVWVVLLAGVVTTFNACNEEPDPIPAIVGTWSRSEYILTELPSTFSYFEGESQGSLGDTGYTLVIKADGTYTRSVTFSQPPNVNDKGTWTLDGTKLVLSPDDPDDIDIIEGTFIGLEFDIEGEITDLRLEMSAPLSICCIPSNAAIDASEASGEDIPESEFKAVDIVLVYKFNRL